MRELAEVASLLGRVCQSAQRGSEDNLAGSAVANLQQVSMDLPRNRLFNRNCLPLVSEDLLRSPNSTRSNCCGTVNGLPLVRKRDSTQGLLDEMDSSNMTGREHDQPTMSLAFEDDDLSPASLGLGWRFASPKYSDELLGTWHHLGSLGPSGKEPTPTRAYEPPQPELTLPDDRRSPRVSRTAPTRRSSTRSSLGSLSRPLDLPAVLGRRKSNCPWDWTAPRYPPYSSSDVLAKPASPAARDSVTRCQMTGGPS